MRCFHCDKLELGLLPDDALERRERDHLFKVLRARSGDRLLLTDGRGGMAEAVVVDNCGIRVEHVERLPEPRLDLHLFVAPPRRRKLDEMLSQCAELGVGRIVPIVTERSVSIPSGAGAMERMRARLVEGCKQSKNPFTPELGVPTDFDDAVSLARGNCDALFFGALETNRGSSLAPGEFASGRGRVSVAWFVGPEGGFTDSEIESLRAAGAAPLNLGPWTLRVETAVVAGLAVLIRGFRGLET